MSQPSTSLPLADIHLPSDVSAWPPAIGWWLVAALVLVAVFIGYRIIKYHQRRAYRKAALGLLEQYKPGLSEAKPSALLALLKRTAITAYPDQGIGALHGKQWVDFLNRQTPKPYFDDSLCQYLIEQQYRADHDSHEISAALYRAVSLWVKHHSMDLKEAE